MGTKYKLSVRTVGPNSVTDMLGDLGQISLSDPRFCISGMRDLIMKVVLLKVWSVDQYHLVTC